MSANVQTLCDELGCSDLLDGLRGEMQAVVGGPPTYGAKLGGKFEIFAKLSKLLSNLTDKQIHDLGGIDAVKALVGKLFDDYVAPIDLPYVPNILEATLVDPWLRASLIRIVDEIHNAVHMGS